MQPSREIIQIQVGAFAAIGLLLLMTVIFLLGSEKKFFEKEYTLTARFDDISGLRAGAPVQLAGIHVGTVTEILFDEQIEQKKVKVVLRITRRFRERIRADSQASIVTQGLLGDKMIFLTIGSTTATELKEGDEISAAPPSVFYQLLGKEGQDVVTRVKGITTKIDSILEEVQSGSGIVNALIYSPEGKDLVTDLKTISQNLSVASGNMARVSGKINNGQGTLGALVNDPTLFNDIKTLLGKANRNKLIRAVVRLTLQTKEEKVLKQ